MSFAPFVVLQVVVFAGLVLLLRRLLTRNLTDATAHLQHMNAEYSRRHEELKQRLEAAEQQYREQTARAKLEAEQIVAQARQEAQSSRAKLLEGAHTESERIVQQGLESRGALRKEIEQTMDARATERACELLQTALPGPLRQEIQNRWFQELLQNGLTQLDRLKSDEAVHEAKVVSALPLSAEQRSALREKLHGKFGRQLVVKEETDEHLVAGLMITLGSRVLDGSLASKVRQAARHAQRP